MVKPEQTEKWLNQPPAQVYQMTPLMCPVCMHGLWLRQVTLGNFPYTYADLGFYCPTCERWYHFCLPQDPIMPTGLSIYDDRKEIPFYDAVLSYWATLPWERECPFGHGEMRLSKIFGNQVYKDGTVRVQYRCDVCHYFIHKTIVEGKQK